MIPGFRLPFRSTRWLYGIGLAALVLLAIIPVLIAQTPRRPPAGLAGASRALIEGRYDEVATITARLDQQDPFVAAVKARALIARGKYQDAETVLRPVAQRLPTSDAALELGLLLQMLTRPEALAILDRVADTADVVTDPNDLARAARALRALDRAQEANSVYRDAAAAAPRDPAINAAWGDLFLEKYRRDEALKSYEMVIQADPGYGPAWLGAAHALSQDDPPRAAEAAKKALEINPSDVGAHLFVASQAADAGKRDEARSALEKALSVNPSSLDAIAMLAGLAYVEDKQSEYQQHVDKALAVAPNYGEVHRVAGEMVAHAYRFEEAVALAKRALALSPNDANSLADLGLYLLRTGDETEARTVLESSFKIDPFNVVTYNLLQMMDTLDTFVTVKDADIILRMDKDEAPVLQDYALRLSRQALDTLQARYKFKVSGPILIEIFPKHDHFAVRSVGLPGMIGALGACFGKVVTMDSPRARPPGEFMWEATLWHELAHVITLQMSEQRIPRWLTEGISEYEETIARPEWGRGMDLVFAQLMNSNETIKLKDLNSAFTDPRKISIAYFEATLLVQHLVATYGDAALNNLVRAFSKGVDTDTALRQTSNTDLTQLQAGFDQFLEKKYGTVRRALMLPSDKPDLEHMPLELLRPYAAKNPGSFPVQMALGEGLRKAGDTDAAIAAFQRAAELVPYAKGPDSPHMQIAEMATEKNDRRLAIATYTALLDVDFDNIEAARKLARLHTEAGTTDVAALRKLYERIVAIDPFDAEAHRRVGQYALQRNDAQTAIREFRAVIALKPVDQAAALTDLAESYLRANNRTDARRQTLAALEIAPSYERAQKLLLELAGAR